MKPLGISQYRLAKDIGIPPIRISQIIRGERFITVDTAMRLARKFRTSAAIWLRLQVRYDLEAAKASLNPIIEKKLEYWIRKLACEAKASSLRLTRIIIH